MPTTTSPTRRLPLNPTPAPTAHSRGAPLLVAAQLVSLDEGRLWATRPGLALLTAAGLTTFAQIMATSQGQRLRRLADRENWRLELPALDGPRGAYLKKHVLTRQRAWFRPGVHPVSAGMCEAENVLRLAVAGVPSMPLVACGQRRDEHGRIESFVLTEELLGFTQLDHFLRRRFPSSIAAAGAPRDRAFNQLLANVAQVAQRFHRAGFNHRDFYCCHFFIAEPAPGRFDVHLIDLQRVEQRRWWRWRWVVKDLAQLAYSAPRERVSATRRLAFIKHYLGISRLAPRDKRLIRAVLAKQAAMQRRLGDHP